MDHRRPIRPPHPAGAPRRPLFHASSTGSSHPSRANSRTTAASKPTTVHISPDDTNNPDNDLVERDAAGNYKIMAPSAAMKAGVAPPISPEQEEKDQEDQIIALYGQNSCHWDQAGRDGGCVRRGAGALCEAMERLSPGDQDEWEWDGWGFWDAEARIAMLEDTQWGIEVEGFCKWTNEQAVLDEIKAALKSSLERKVASLETDRWMFEGDGGKGLR
ncbi:hypothetical protein P171DRAFT_483667 [Karstenula rhodostoma CBS 690.94]|uniref:Uncharacterized protein n=1 Tax=Karstenula rhodostoma CBS 690.94 TaxID=1392251 RepID=A0A9P4UEC8_9PLEO|nr:hypothetical protein P171DRAFT_483667 [Karstenula rhodostoma CBS 690.94]